jgi:hypothetical protein
VAGEITANRPPVQHCGNHTFRKGDLPTARSRFNGPEKITFAEIRSARPDRRPGLLFRLSVQPFGQP